MVRNEDKYSLAVEYRKRGFTYSEIAKIVGVSKATLSVWLSKKAFSKRVRISNVEQASRDNVKRIALLHKAKQTERAKQYKDVIKAAETEYKHYRHSPLFTAGLMIYLSAGDFKDSSRIRLSSNKPETHRIFIAFLRDFMGVEDSSVAHWLLLPAGAADTKEMKWWSRAIKLSVSHFGKTQFTTTSLKQGLHHGTGNTIIGNTVLKKKLIRWIELASKEI